MKRYVKIMVIALFAVMQVGTMTSVKWGHAATTVCALAGCAGGAYFLTKEEKLNGAASLIGALSLGFIDRQGICDICNTVLTGVAKVISGNQDASTSDKVAAAVLVCCASWGVYKIYKWIRPH